MERHEIFLETIPRIFSIYRIIQNGRKKGGGGRRLFVLFFTIDFRPIYLYLFRGGRKTPTDIFRDVIRAYLSSSRAYTFSGVCFSRALVAHNVTLSPLPLLRRVSLMRNRALSLSLSRIILSWIIPLCDLMRKKGQEASRISLHSWNRFTNRGCKKSPRATAMCAIISGRNWSDEIPHVINCR